MNNTSTAPLVPTGKPAPLVAYSCRADGNMSYRWGEEAQVATNRERFLATHQRTIEQCVEIEVEHSDQVSIVDTSHTLGALGTTIQTEALITTDRAVTLFLMTADCLPVTLYDPNTQAIALAHLGWKPTGLQLLPKVIAAMTNTYGTNPADVRVWVGPSIKKASYVQTEVQQKDDPAWQPYVTKGATGYQIDLLGFNIAQLQSAGVLRDSISINPTDTAVEADYFSHYRAVRTGEPEGRFATIAALPKND